MSPLVSLASRSRIRSDQLAIYCRRSCSLPSGDAMATAFDPALPFCAASSHCSTGSGSTKSSSLLAASVSDNSFCACGIAPEDAAWPLTASR